MHGRPATLLFPIRRCCMRLSHRRISIPLSSE
jgi:hypothetical protein